MTLKEICKKLNARVLTKEFDLPEMNGGFAGDLLSVVMGKAKSNQVWVTIQSHINIVAVASLVDLALIIVCEAYEVDEEAIAKANEEEILIISTDLSEFEVCAILSKEGIV